MPSPDSPTEARQRSFTSGERIRELLSRTAAGEDGALTTLYDTLAPRVWAIARSATDSYEQAETVTVQTFQDLRRCAADCPADPDAAIVWALGIAVRHSTHEYRPDGRSSASNGDRRGDQVVGPALSALPQRQREAVLLACCGQLTVRQVASVLQTDQQATAELLRAGLVGVRGLLAGGARPSEAVPQ